MPGATLGGDIFQGLPLACPALAAGSSGLVLISSVNAFDVPGAGDVQVSFDLGCE